MASGAKHWRAGSENPGRGREADRENGWIAEFAIPFKSLNFPAAKTVWGFNISRTIQRKLEENRWTGARFQTQFFQVSEAGEITNLVGLEQGVGLDVRPFVAQRWRHRSPTGEDVVIGKPGLDMFYNITPSLKLSATANTDFGETEVDARQINLTRFSIFFPEKRSFFLQDAGVFNLRTRDVAVAEGSDLFVGRVKQNFLEQSYVGALFTGGDPALPLSSSTTWSLAPTVSRASTKEYPTRTRRRLCRAVSQMTDMRPRSSGARSRRISIQRSVSFRGAMCGCYGLAAASTRARGNRSAPGVILPAGEYRFTPLRVFFSSAQKRRLQGSFGASFGNFWSGTAKAIQTGLSYKVPPNFSISLETNQTFARLPQGNFVARIVSSQINYAFSPFLSFSNVIQFDNRSGNLGLQSRVRWTLKPGNDLFFIFGQGWIQELSGGYDFRQQDTRLATKLQYTFRF